MRNASVSLIDFDWAPQPQARAGLAHAFLEAGTPQLEAICVPYPYRRHQRKRPLERKDQLFEAVAALTDCDTEGAAEFARSWGLLSERLEPFSFEPPEILMVDEEGAQVVGLPPWSGQRLEEWRREGAQLREAIELWRSACEKDRDALARVVHVEAPSGRPVVRYRSPLAELDIFTTREPYLVIAGRIALAALINRHIETQLETRYDGTRPHRLRLAAKPKDLCSAAWLQLAEVVTRDRAKSCPRCGKTFIVSSTAPGTRADYCSGACRQAQYRRRRGEPRRKK